MIITEDVSLTQLNDLKLNNEDRYGMKLFLSDPATPPPPLQPAFKVFNNLIFFFF